MPDENKTGIEVSAHWSADNNSIYLDRGDIDDGNMITIRFNNMDKQTRKQKLRTILDLAESFMQAELAREIKP